MSSHVRATRATLLSQLGSSIFSEVAAWKRETASQGIDVIDLSVGSPDRSPSVKVREALADAVMREDMYTYPGMKSGLPFKQKVAEWMQHRFGVAIDPLTEVCTLSGSQDGLAHLALAIAERDTYAILPDPGYPIYAASLAIAGVKPYFIPLIEEHQYVPILEDIPEHVLLNASFILLNYPNNPLTAVADLSFFERLVAFAKQHSLLVVHDLAYSEMSYDGFVAPSIFEVEGAKEVAVEFHSLSKSFNMAGSRIGFLVGNTEVVSSLAALKANIDYGVFEPIQEAGIVALDEAMHSDTYISAEKIYEKRRNAFIEQLHQEGWNVELPTATMFVWAKLPERKVDSWTSRMFVKQLLEETGVALIPGDAFGKQGEGYVRIALVEDEERLLEAARRIGRFIKLHK